MPQPITIEFENYYSDGHESKTTDRVPGPEALDDDAIETWFQEVVFEFTGDGHAAHNPGMTATYEATVTEGPAELVGKTYSWG